ncbi:MULTISPECIES: HAD-IIIA family hydrolase [unclassified Moorena]|uniref:KdsC family phosphatase n=1 Tax=unclassified Moorena TaxID=2683338 RepID=UPI0013B89D9D|nr:MULTISPECIES: HAD-IIIA family hydrolase [unclassified Moorena]NEO43471.1 HAD-IIIA family hydrolase [Moorena sp. SIO4A3]NEP22335.1 HAD-IIIA family hydrolase [Moorena sp. SIO3I6]NEQ63246.1 HAD-IIIA family hydrolase [Moorena sp. SIO4A1]NEQ79847.1 HAD-IIIA family hydrolase [Moorena sp. SIO2I5]
MRNNSETHLSQVKLLALDVDGVMTDGGLYYTESGEELRKFNVKDGMGIKLLQRTGIEVAVITNSSCRATQYRVKKLGIKYNFFTVEDKLAVLKELCEELSLSLFQVAYVGDDIIDLPVMEAVGCPLTVADAIPENRDMALYVTKLAGGQGAVREICELLIKAQVKVKSYYKNND